MKKIAFASLLTLGLFALPAFGLEGKVSGQEIPALQYALDPVWVIFAAVLVFFMQAGFAMVESGFTRAKNASNIMMKNMMDLVVGSISFWAVGFGVMFCFLGVVRGAGDTLGALIMVALNLIVIRTPLCFFLAEYTPLRERGLWLGINIGMFIGAFLYYLYYRSGRWKKKKKELLTCE